ncbi:MAG: hypothetical protein O2798_11440 [Chloroflexi bacterium]|nr:hypothetical protein [Chloroflexota bacterium]
MRRALPTLLPWTLVLAGSTALFLMLQWPEGLGSGLMWKQPAGHFWVVSVASITCLGIALVATVAAIRTANARVVLLALSFLSMAGVFSVHGLTTPGFFLDAASSPAAVAPPVALVSTDSDYGGSSPGPNPEQVTPAPSGPPRYLMVTGFSGRLALALAALFLAASAIPWPGRVERALVRWRRGVLGGAVGLLALYAWLALTQPQLVPAWLVQREAFAWGTLALVTVCGLGAAVRFIIGYRRSGLTMYAAVSLGALMLVQAAFSVHFGSTWSARSGSTTCNCWSGSRQCCGACWWRTRRAAPSSRSRH